ncbi:MAG: cytochrome c [Betaproteobacteria bacterium]|jgi:mono/diheme cytochrome c family protein|nr:cytochrome c [Betaproteobacteria bacterium]
MRTLLTLAVAGIAVLLALPSHAQMGGGRGMMQGGGGMMGGSMVRHRFAMHNGIPAEYKSKKNPLKATSENIAAGRTLYTQNCAVCHGPKGAGDGEGGKALNPPPGNLVGLGRMPVASDGFLMWTISEGGTPVKSAMPPYKSVLKEEDIWRLILYVRTL